MSSKVNTTKRKENIALSIVSCNFDSDRTSRCCQAKDFYNKLDNLQVITKNETESLTKKVVAREGLLPSSPGTYKNSRFPT